MAAAASEEVRIEVNLRKIRAESERLGQVPAHVVTASELCRDLRSLLATSPGLVDPTVEPVAMSVAAPASKDAFQIIDAIGIAVGSIGVAGLVKLIPQIVEACRAKIPTSYEIEVGGKKIKMSGPRLRVEDLRALREALEELEQPASPTLYSPSGKLLRIDALPRDR